MSTEVKMVYAEVETKLNEMQQVTEALNPKAEPPITGNVLDVVTKFTTLAENVENLLTNYQQLLMKNIQSTENSVRFMRESDEQISKAIDTTCSAPTKVSQ